MPDGNRAASHKQNSSENLDERPQLKLSTENIFMMGKAQNRQKREEIFVIF